MIQARMEGAARAMEKRAEPSVEFRRGVYDAHRAAALSGVPETTLHYWARKGIYEPSISPDPRTRHWSWMDLLALRMVDWLRHNDIPMSRIRQAIKQIESRDIPRQRLHQIVAGKRGREVYVDVGDAVVHAAPGQQEIWQIVLDPVLPYGNGPHLTEPRPLLRIIPGKLHGEPHVVDTRISSATIYALSLEGYSLEDISAMYPDASPEAIRQAIDLEQSLTPAAA